MYVLNLGVKGLTNVWCFPALTMRFITRRFIGEYDAKLGEHRMPPTFPTLPTLIFPSPSHRTISLLGRPVHSNKNNRTDIQPTVGRHIHVYKHRVPAIVAIIERRRFTLQL